MPLIELRKAGLSAVSQHPINVYYHADLVGNFIADIIVGEQVILEIKAITQLSKAHEVQLVNYLTATKVDTGLLINFGPSKVEVKRKIRILESQEQKTGLQDIQDSDIDPEN